MENVQEQEPATPILAEEEPQAKIIDRYKNIQSSFISA